jgi:hypothetical protein
MDFKTRVQQLRGQCDFGSLEPERVHKVPTLWRRGDKRTYLEVSAAEEVKIWGKWIDRLRTWLGSTDTAALLINSICSGALQWQGSRVIDNTSCEVGKLQDELGWGLVIEGCLGMQWRLSQQKIILQLLEVNVVSYDGGVL